MNLTDFLLARIAEDEAVFEIAVAAEVAAVRRDGMPDMSAQEVRDYWLRPAGNTGDPVADTRTEWPRYLAECEAKRRIVDTALGVSGEQDYGDVDPGLDDGQVWAFGMALQALARVYADHPDYQAEWAIA